MATNIEIYVNALVKKFESDRATAVANLNTYLTNPAGIGDHSNIVGEMEALVASISSADGNLSALRSLVEKNTAKPDE